MLPLFFSYREGFDRVVCVADSIDGYVETVQTAPASLHNLSNSPRDANRTFKGREYTAHCNPFGQISNFADFQEQ